MKIDCGHEFPSDSSISFTFDLKFSGLITSVRVWTQYHENTTVSIDNENAWHLQCLNITNETTVSDLTHGWVWDGTGQSREFCPLLQPINSALDQPVFHCVLALIWKTAFDTNTIVCAKHKYPCSQSYPWKVEAF